MGNVTSLLAQRLKKSAPSKMSEMARQTSSGSLNSFTSIFSITNLSEQERNRLETLLNHYAEDIPSQEYQRDLEALIALTTEVKAITNQAAILHGERIKKAQQLLTKYRDGVFSEWLLTTYGNRQTPYNFLMYYEFYLSLPENLKTRAEQMPRQAIYTLAGRNGELKTKHKIVENYKGETKNELISLIRLKFPLAEHDKRGKDQADKVIHSLSKLNSELIKLKQLLKHTHKAKLKEIIEDLYSLLK